MFDNFGWLDSLRLSKQANIERKRGRQRKRDKEKNIFFRYLHSREREKERERDFFGLIQGKSEIFEYGFHKKIISLEVGGGRGAHLSLQQLLSPPLCPAKRHKDFIISSILTAMRDRCVSL